jgi:hypothetical protein
MGRSERRFEAANPEVNLQLPDGSRLFATIEVSARPSLISDATASGCRPSTNSATAA